MNNQYDKPIFTDAAPNEVAPQTPQTAPLNDTKGITTNTSEHQDDEKSKGNLLSKLLIAFLAIATGSLGYYTYSLNRDKQATENELNAQKEQVLRYLNALKGSYDKVVDENRTANQDLLEARDKISQYIDSLQRIKLNVSALVRFKSQAFALAKERDLLLKKNDSLMRVNKFIRRNLDSVSVKLNSTTAKADSLARQAYKLRKTIEAGAALQISKLSIEAVKNAKNKPTDKAKAAEKIKVCFTVEGNKIAQSGTRFFYIKLISPSDTTMGANESTTVGTNTIHFSTATRLIYDNKSVDVCDFVAKTAKSFDKGTYKVLVYDDKLNEVGTANLILK